MIKKIISVILTVIMISSLCTVAFATVDENYDIFMLPVISDTLTKESQVSAIELYLDKEANTAFANLEDICKMIGALCSQEDDRYAVQRDSVYFEYNNENDMKLYLLSENNTSVFIDAVGLSTENIIRQNISGICLLSGNLFESRKINNKWYVDYIKFCDMFGVRLSKYTAEDNAALNATLNAVDVTLGYNVPVDFDKNPYYIKMYSGTTLSSIYQKVMRGQDTYFYDYTSLKLKDADFWDKVAESLNIAKIQNENILSNVINDWNGFTSAYYETYSSEEHYTESLLNILNANYLQYAIEDIDNTDKNETTFADLTEFSSNALSLNENLENYVNYVDALAENNNDYKKALQSMAEMPDEVTVTVSIAKIVLSSASSFEEVNDTCEIINNLGSDKRTMLKNCILENEKLQKSSEKIEDVLKLGNILAKVGGGAGNYTIKAIHNSVDNTKGLIDSAQKIYDIYGDIGKQTYEKLEAVSKTAVYTLSDEVIQTALSSTPETVPLAIAMSVIDGSMSLAKATIGEELKNAENLVQYYYIEQRTLKDLNESNPKKLHSNLTFALMASLCCYEAKKKDLEYEFQRITTQEEYDFLEKQINDLDDTINNISEVLYELDYSKTKLCIDYYNDPRDNNVSNDIKEAILNYQAVIKDNNTINEEQLKKYEKIYKDYVDSEAWRTYEDSAGNGTITNNGRLVVKYTEIFDFDGDSIPEMLLYTYNPSSTPKEESHTLFCTIKNDKVETLLSANSVGGTLDGNRVEISYDKKENNFVVGLSGHVGGFGGNSYFEEWYKYNSGLIDKTIEYHSIEFSNKNNGSDKYTVNGNSVSKNILSVTEDRFCRVDYEDLPLLFDSPDREKLLKEQENPSILYSDRIQKYNGQVYYTTGEDIGSQFAVNYDFSYLGYKILPVNKSVLDFIIYNDRIYYIYVEFGLDLKFNLMSCDLFGKNSETIAENVEENFIIKDNILQFSVSKNDYGRTYNNYNIDTGEITAVSYENILIYYSGKISEGHVFDGGYYYYVYPDVSEEYGVLKADERIYRRDNKTGEVCEVGKRWHQER